MLGYFTIVNYRISVAQANGALVWFIVEVLCRKNVLCFQDLITCSAVQILLYIVQYKYCYEPSASYFNPEEGIVP